MLLSSMLKSREADECALPNRMFLAFETVALGLLLILGVSALLKGTSTTLFMTLFIVYLLLGGVLMLEKISIMHCPSKILFGTAVFILGSLGLHSVLF